MIELPARYEHGSIEKKWQQVWDESEVYKWDSSADRENTFSVDTPPPTVSGSLHVGHVFSYTQTDVLARYQRMCGKSVFYPMGWDDNGLPTERRVQNVFGITCDPTLAYDAAWAPEKRVKDGPLLPVSRRNFIDACRLLTAEDEQAFESMWRQLGLSVDWSLQYATIDRHCQRVSQYSFLEMAKKGYVYQVESPTMWDVDFRTAVAQAEVEDRPRPGAYHHVQFLVEHGGSFTIVTTRPELLPACIAVVAHPDDARYKDLFGKFAITPLFGARVPIMASTHADPEKGSGILMVCTFGDASDVAWWKQQSLPIKQVIGANGRLVPVDFTKAPFESVDAETAAKWYAPLEGLRVKQAQTKIAELLVESGAMSQPLEIIEHPVKFYEKGDSPLEFMKTRQWFVRILEHKEALVKQGDKIEWHPSFMKARYQNWVEGLNQDWCISRQRFFGVSFPVWYPMDALGNPDYAKPIFAREDQLPVDPMSDVPDGFTEAQRGKPNGFMGDPDVMDTWATSSLTPQIASQWPNNDRHAKIFPMDIRPQSHEIIRTWAFYTITKAWMHHQEIPWKHVVISGWVLDPDRKKMSKSKGNVVTPNALLDQYSSDAVRYWATRARLGVDTAFEETIFQMGQKLATKLFNASKFVMLQLGDEKPTADQITQPVDVSYLQKIKGLADRATTLFNALDYAGALEAAEAAFWTFCDHYIELVKIRAYREEDDVKRMSALATLQEALKTFLCLFAPFLPYVTEEIWSWRFSNGKSLHKTSWPTYSDYDGGFHPTYSLVFDSAMIAMAKIRGTKSDHKQSLKCPVKRLVIHNNDQKMLDYYKFAKSDICFAGVVAPEDCFFELRDGEPGIEVVL
ncbi:MAG: valine--tRNA ligase [Candidatus Margulisbacteria bacterium]|nr:valine--tRNA ligase [Candidatus Margulisiibacteriota bacterium]